MESFFIPQPLPTGATKHGANAELPTYKCAGFPNEMMWSGKMPLPAIGDRVYMHINNIGWGKVEGYADSGDDRNGHFVGLLVKPENPPEWFWKQTKRVQSETARALRIGPEKAQIERLRISPQWILDGICCVFGIEISLEGPKPRVAHQPSCAKMLNQNCDCSCGAR